MCSSRAFGFSASLSCSVQSPNTLFLDTEDRCEPTFLASVCSVMAVLGLWGSEQRTITLTRRWLPISTTLGSTEESLRRPAPSAGVADFARGLLAFLFASVCLSADCLMCYQELHPTLYHPFLRHQLSLAKPKAYRDPMSSLKLAALLFCRVCALTSPESSLAGWSAIASLTVG